MSDAATLDLTTRSTSSTGASVSFTITTGPHERSRKAVLGLSTRPIQS
jgi:hypothetical protein